MLRHLRFVRMPNAMTPIMLCVYVCVYIPTCRYVCIYLPMYVHVYVCPSFTGYVGAQYLITPFRRFKAVMGLVGFAREPFRLLCREEL